jgi:hypothetical protein
MRWAAHVARVINKDVYAGFWCENVRKGDDFEDISLNEPLLLKIDINRMGIYGLDYSGLV